MRSAARNIKPTYVADSEARKMIEIEAEMDASVWQVLVEPGQSIAKDDELIILESMKMEIPVVARSPV